MTAPADAAAAAAAPRQASNAPRPRTDTAAHCSCATRPPSLATVACARQTHAVTRVRRHPRLAAAAAFGLLAIAVELLGRSLTERIDVGKHVAAPSYAHAG